MFDNPFSPDLGFQRRGCSCGEHESEFAHEKLTALEASRQARRRFIAESVRNLFRGSPSSDRPETRGAPVRVTA